MALAYTRPGLQAQLDAFTIAKDALDFTTARLRLMDYATVWAGINVESANSPGFSLKLPRPDVLRQEFDAFERAIIEGGDRLYEIHSRWVP